MPKGKTPKTVVGKDGGPLPVSQDLSLAIEGFRKPFRYFHLIWVLGEEVWPAQEDQIWYRQVEVAIEAGQQLAAKYGVTFSETVRKEADDASG